jgi:hypothetical protein
MAPTGRRPDDRTTAQNARIVNAHYTDKVCDERAVARTDAHHPWPPHSDVALGSSLARAAAVDRVRVRVQFTHAPPPVSRSHTRAAARVVRAPAGLVRRGWCRARRLSHISAGSGEVHSGRATAISEHHRLPDYHYQSHSPISPPPHPPFPKIIDYQDYHYQSHQHYPSM